MVDIAAAREAVAALLDALDLPVDDHLAETPARVAKAWADAVAGYGTDPGLHLKTRFSAPPNPGLVVVSRISVTSTCAHHMLPITGYATVAYRPLPGDDIVGLSKLARVVEGYARRLQVQERLGADVVESLMTHLRPVGAACFITAQHGCMTLRGIHDRNTLTTTYTVDGALDDTDLTRVRTEHQSNRE